MGAAAAAEAGAPAPPPSPGGGALLSESARRFLSGAVSGTVTAAVLQPFDVVRTVQQGRQAPPGGSGAPAAPRLGPIRTARQLVAAGGVSSLWRGLGPTITRVFFGAGIYFSSIHAISDALKGGGGDGAAAPAALSDAARAFVAGFSARTLAATLLSPVAVVKTRMEWTPRQGLPYRSTLGGVAHIARTEGLGALYSGLIPTLVRDSPFSGLYFTLYSRLKAVLEAPEVAALVPYAPLRNFAAASAAGALATVLTQPADVIRTRLQIGALRGVGVWQAGTVLVNGLAQLARTEGVRALFVGGVARIAKRALSTAVTWTLYEEAMKAR